MKRTTVFAVTLFACLVTSHISSAHPEPIGIAANNNLAVSDHDHEHSGDGPSEAPERQGSCGEGLELGESIYRIPSQDANSAVDVIMVVDESERMDREHRWLPGMVQALEERLKERNIGVTPKRPNLYYLVGFGLLFAPGGDHNMLNPYPHYYTNFNGKSAMTADEFPEAASRLIAQGNEEDGYLAIEFAIKNITNRDGTQALRLNTPGIAQNLILITDEDRDILPKGGNKLTRRSMKRLFRKNSIIPNFVVDQRFYSANVEAIGIDYLGNAYIADGNGGFSVHGHARHGVPFGNTRKDYSSLALQKNVRGAAWDINLLRNGGRFSESFTAAFVHVKSAEIVRQLQITTCRECICKKGGVVHCRRARNEDLCCTIAGGIFNKRTNICEAV